MYRIMKMETLKDLVESFRDRKSMCLEGSSEYSYRQAYRKIVELSCGFLSMGLKPGDRVMLISKNRPEWMITSLALNYAGIIDVPRGEKVSERDLRYILKHSQPKHIIIENESLLKRFKDFKNLVSIEKIRGVTDLDAIQEKGKRFEGSFPEISPDTVASHLYTSGTTGEPKGAELTHGNYVANFIGSTQRIKLEYSDRVLSILPLWHVFERLVEYAFLHVGGSIYYTTISNFADDLKLVHPTCLSVVPRILEKIFDNRVLKKIQDKSFLAKKFFKIMVKLSAESRKPNFNLLRLIQSIPRSYMDKKVFCHLREAFGGKMRLLISGGGKLRRDIDLFFYAAGMPILEGYGLTETSPVIAVRSPDNFVMGTVGRPLDNLQVKIVDHDTGKELRPGKPGVIFVRGPSVMKRYYKNEYETRKCFVDGWFDTGDLGYIDHHGNLVITGRMKNIIVLSSGENVSPEPLEETLKKNPLIANAVVLGQDWKGLAALIEPDFENLEQIKPGSGKNIRSDEVMKIYKRIIRDTIRPLTGFREFERIRSFKLLQAPMELGRELTETMKVRRQVIEKLYSREIAELNREINGGRI